MRKRILVSAMVGVASGTFCWFVLERTHQGSADLRWAIHLAERLLSRQNPYDTPLEQYPLPAALVAFPLLRLRPEVAAGVFYGLSSFFLALGLTHENYGRLRIFLAYPYWAGLLTAQWSVAIAASAFFPLLLPLTMMKPQVGLPVFLTRLSRRGVLACLIVAGASLLMLPQWPWMWLHQGRYYEHFIPLLVFPGPLLLLALLRYRDRDACLLLLSALLPQRWFFDSFILWLIPKTNRQITGTVLLSWGAGLWRWYHAPHGFAQVGRWAVVFFYLPMLAVVLFRSPPDSLAGEDSRL